MKKELSELFMQDEPGKEFLNVEEDLALSVSIENSVVFRFDEKTNNFDFETERAKGFEVIHGKLPFDEFETDLSVLFNDCNQAFPNSYLKAWVLWVVIIELLVISLLFLIIWIILILDLVILALEYYCFKRIKRVILKWRKKKLETVWVQNIEKFLQVFNYKYEKLDLTWKFDPGAKWIQLSKKRPESAVLN